jgi:hypothetical protein
MALFMNKILQPIRLSKTLLLLLVVASACHLSACHPGTGGEPVINPDSVRQHILPIGQAVQYTANFRTYIDSFSKKTPHFTDSVNFGHAESFPKDVFYELLRQSNDKQGAAAGIRIYYGRDNAGMVRMILVPYDSSGNDIINHIIDLNGKPVSGEKVEALSVSGGQTIQDGQRCPTVCDNGTSGLN